MKDFESLAVISVEFYWKVNTACFKCLRMINSWKHTVEMYKANQNESNVFSYIILIKSLK